MEALRKTVSDSERMRTKIIIALVSAIAAISILTFLLPDNMILNSDGSVTITAGIAMVSAIVVVARQKTKGLYGKTYVALTAGLVCWFIGEMIWAYDDVIVGKEQTQLSLADIPWLALYGFYGYYIFKTYQFFGYAVNKYHLIIVISIVAMIITYTTYAMLSSPDNTESLAVAAVRLMYPFGDAILIVPSVLLLITLRHGLLTYTPWLFVSAGLVLIATADIFFTNVSMLIAPGLPNIIFILYNAGNLAFAGALVWYNKFGVYDQKGAINSFQESNK